MTPTPNTAAHHPTLIPVDPNFAATAYIDADSYRELYAQSIHQPETFWGKLARETLLWAKPFKQVFHGDFAAGQVAWFGDGELNVSVNCIDRHLPEKAAQTAIIWQGDEPDQQELISYQQLHDRVCQLANALLSLGIGVGDRVCIYLPMIPEAAYAMLACARIGAIHSVVFGGFSADALRDRLVDADCCCVITADAGMRGGKRIALKNNVDQALENLPRQNATGEKIGVKNVLVVRHADVPCAWHGQRDHWYHSLVSTQSKTCAPTAFAAETPLFILYTSGSTGKPKGVLHSSAGYLLQASLTFRWVFDYHPGDVFWCTADVGWITGHSYLLYGPLACGATTLMFGGVPTYPNPARCWEIIDHYRVTQFYTAPTAIRALMAQGNSWLESSHRRSLKLLGSVGEPINPEAWQWYYQQVGQGRCPIVDTWWQTETGAIMLTSLPGAHHLKPGMACQPFFGVQPALLDDQGHEIHGGGRGQLVIKHSWPSQLRTVYQHHQRCQETYYQPFPGFYTSGDGAQRDEDGDYRILGRVDDVLNVSGHRLGTAEIESALVEHPAVAEAAVVGFAHAIKGEGIYAFVTLMVDYTPQPHDEQQLKEQVIRSIGAIAKPDIIQFAPALPKTRSGKIMRRILRKIAQGDVDSLGDTSTLADANVVLDLVQNRKGLGDGEAKA
jgi:acetyl-CoA synthetase